MWKVRPVLKRVLQSCLDLPRPTKLCIDEQIVPFTGRSSVCAQEAESNGFKGVRSCKSRCLVLDLEIYMGKNTFTQVRQMGIGVNAVLGLTETLPRGSLVYFEQYFTTISLLDTFRKRGLPATGTIQKQRIPKECHFTADNVLSTKPRGSS